MKKTYRVVGIPAFHGLHVTGVDCKGATFLSVEEFINTGVMLGDRQLRYLMPVDSVLISSANLEETDNVGEREFANDNPFGTYESEHRKTVGKLDVVYVVFEKAVTVTIFDNNSNNHKVIFAGNFFDTKKKAALVAIEVCNDVYDLVFDLKTISAEES